MASQSVDCFAVRIPPAALKPTAIPVCWAYSRIARVITRPTGNVAFVASFPVEVLMKSAPAIMATTLARPTLRRVSKSPVARITFMCAPPQACLKAATSSYSACHRPPKTCARVMTTSISCAPASTERRISATRSASGDSPAGKPVETAATPTPLPSSACRAVSTKTWYTQIAATLTSSSSIPSCRTRSCCKGWRALAHRRRTRSSVSSPESVVRSMQEIARSSHAACHSFFTVRRAACD